MVVVVPLVVGLLVVVVGLLSGRYEGLHAGLPSAGWKTGIFAHLSLAPGGEKYYLDKSQVGSIFK